MAASGKDDTAIGVAIFMALAVAIAFWLIVTDLLGHDRAFAGVSIILWFGLYIVFARRLTRAPKAGQPAAATSP